jgi:hypothetical protein
VATPAALNGFMISPRLDKIKDFSDMVNILFYDGRSGGAIDKSRIPLKARHATGLAQDTNRSSPQ